MATAPNPDEFEPKLDGSDRIPDNIQRGSSDAFRDPKADTDPARPMPQEENQLRGMSSAGRQPHEQGIADPYSQGAPHQSSPNYGDFGHAPSADASGNFQPRYGQETPPDDISQTKRGDDRFRHSGTQNIETNEPANPHHGPEDKHNT